MNKRRFVAIFLLTLFMLPSPTLISTSAAGKNAAASKLSPALASSIAPQSGGLMPVIILTNGAPSLLLKTLITLLGGVIKLEFTYLNGLAASIPLSGLGTLLNLTGVLSITPDRLMLPLMDVTRAATGADAAQQSFGLNGSGIGIAVIDSGINSGHEDLVTPSASVPNRVVYSRNYVQGESTTQDLYGHGTHVAGIIAGDGSASSGPSSYRTIKGTAPAAHLINLRVLNSQGTGAESDVIAAIEKAISLKNSYNIRIINLSLGAGVLDSYNKDPLCKVSEIAWNKGLVVVASAGNYGNTEYGPYGLITSPGISPSVITVGASNSMGTPSVSDDIMTTYSSRGPTLFDHVLKPDLVAPGNKIKSLVAPASSLALDPKFAGNKVDPSYYYTDTTGKSVQYFTMSGTSMAAPTVSGAAALMLQKEPSLNNHTVKLRLMASANKILSQNYDIFTTGAGLLDVSAALQQTGAATSSKSPYVERDPNNPNLYLAIDDAWGTQSPWGSGVIWGVNKVGGGGVIWGVAGVWGNGVIWGVTSPFEDPSSNLYNAAAQRDISASGD